MSLTRDNQSEQYYNDTHHDGDQAILQRMDDVYAESITLNQSFWSEADIDTRFKAGDQTLWSDLYGNLPSFRKKQFYFNRIRRVVNMITGYQRQHRKSIIAVPVENSDEVTATQYTKLLMWAFNKSMAQDCISRAFDAGSITTGMSLINVWIDRTRDPISGNIMCDHVSYSSFLIDPYFKKPDLSDCNFIWRRQWLSRNALKSIVPGHDDTIDAMNSRGNRDGKFQFMAESYNYAMYELLTYDEYWYRDSRELTILVDMNTGETMEYDGDQDKLNTFLEQNPTIKAQTSIIPTVKLAIVVEGKVLYNGPNPLNIDRYPFVAFLGYYEPEIPYFAWRIQGVVRNLRDSQYLYNRRKIIELDILESQVNSGFKYKVDSLVNPKDIFLEGQGRGIAIKKNAEMSDVEKILAPDLPPSMIQLSQMLGQEIQEISGVNEELLGSATDDKAGILSMLRQGAGLTTLQTLFDQLDSSVKLLGSIYMELIQKNFSVGKVERILGEKASPQFYDEAFGKFDVEIEEGQNTTTQQQLKFAQLLQMKEVGVPISGADLLEAATIQGKTEIVERVKQQEQQQQQAQQMEQQVQMKLVESQIENMEAKALADQGLGVERLSRVEENRSMATRQEAEAVENIALARLNKVKAIKELQEMDFNQIKIIVDILNSIKLESEEEQVQQVDNSTEFVAQETPSEMIS